MDLSVTADEAFYLHKTLLFAKIKYLLPLSQTLFNQLQPSVAFFIPPEKIRKPKGFLMFSEGIEKQHRTVMG